LAGVEPKYRAAVLLGFLFPVGAVVSIAMNSALPALKPLPASPAVQNALKARFAGRQVQGLGNGFLFLVLIVAAIVTEAIDCHQPRSAKVPDSAGFSWVGLAAVAVVVFSAKRRRGDAFVDGKPPATVHRKALAGGSDLRRPVIL